MFQKRLIHSISSPLKEKFFYDFWFRSTEFQQHSSFSRVPETGQQQEKGVNKMPLNKRERTHLFFGFSSQNFSHVLFEKTVQRTHKRSLFLASIETCFSLLESSECFNQIVLFVKNFCRCCEPPSLSR